MKTIAIIGAGYRGVGCLKVLKERGFQVDLYEKNDDVGGVWHPSNNYKGLRIHTPAKLNQFENFPYPANIDVTERLESKQVYEYLRAYATHFDLIRNMIFNAPVHEIHYDSATKKSHLVVGDDRHKTKEYDYIINTNGFCDKHIPEFKDSDKFKGKILHSFEATEEVIDKLISENKKVTIIGAGKTAADLVCSIRRLGVNLTWLYRKPYYFFRYKLFHDNLRKAVSNEATSISFKMKLLFGFLLGNIFPKLACRFWRWNDIIDTYGERHTDFRKFHVALVDDGEMDILRECSKYYGVRGEIDRFDERGYFTNENKYIEADAVICCTGSSGAKWMADIYIDGKKLDISKVFKAY
ncbi:MAG: flavin-containing monooxygenase, partial [Parachlamydiaceae bacterium]